MVQMKMAREREMCEMLRAGGVGGSQTGKKFWKNCWVEPDPRSGLRPNSRSDLKKCQGESNLFIANPPEQQQLERNEEVIACLTNSRPLHWMISVFIFGFL